MKETLFIVLLMLLYISCSKEDNSSSEEPKLIIKLVTQENQERLGNDGSTALIPSGNAGQTPVFNSLSAHYIEFAPNQFTLLGDGAILYNASETTQGGDKAIDFSQSIIKKSGETFLEIPLSDIAVGEYEWVRLSLSYQNYDIKFNSSGQEYTGTVASFVGFNTYIDDYTVKTQNVNVNANKKQGYWGFESIAGIQTGQSPEGATTVPNPIASTSPIPVGSCVVTGKFNEKLKITSDHSNDITVTMNLSVNKSFEWVDSNNNGKWDVDSSENVVDMGLRGLIPSWQ